MIFKSDILPLLHKLEWIYKPFTITNIKTITIIKIKNIYRKYQSNQN